MCWDRPGDVKAETEVLQLSGNYLHVLGQTRGYQGRDGGVKDKTLLGALGATAKVRSSGPDLSLSWLSLFWLSVIPFCQAVLPAWIPKPVMKEKTT